MSTVLDEPIRRSAARVAPESTAALRRSAGWRASGLVVGLGLLVVVCLASLVWGSKGIPARAAIDALVAFDGSEAHVIVRDLRLPRTLLGVAVGAAMGLGGALMQGVTRNPLADPGVLGINPGAALAVVVAIQVFGVTTLSGYAWFALAGAGIAAVVVYALGSLGNGGASPVKLAIAGAAVAALFTSLTTAVLLTDATTLDQFRFWVVGSIAGRDVGVVTQVLPFLLVGTVIAFAATRGLNALGMGDDVARSLGTNVAATRAAAGVAVMLLCGGAVAAAGPIAFVGLTVAHVARALVGPDHRWLLPYAAVLGAGLVLGADIVGRLVVSPAELQAGVVTALVGAPVFIALVRRRRLAAL